MKKLVCIAGLGVLIVGSGFLGAVTMMAMMGRVPEAGHEAVDKVAESWKFYDRRKA